MPTMQNNTTKLQFQIKIIENHTQKEDSFGFSIMLYTSDFSSSDSFTALASNVLCW